MRAFVDYSLSQKFWVQITLPRTASDPWTLLRVQMPEFINIL